MNNFEKPFHTQKHTNPKEQSPIQPEIYPPIRSIIIDSNMIDSDTEKQLQIIHDEGIEIDYHASVNYFKRLHMLHSGSETYVISTCSPQDKFSKDFYNCTGIIMVGKDKKSKKQLSIMTHQDPEKFLTTKKDDFIDDLSIGIENIKDHTEQGSIDVIILGGHNNLKEYEQSLVLLNKVITEKLNIEPTVIAGPDLRGGPTHAYFNTQKRRLYLIRQAPREDSTNYNFKPSEYSQISKPWQRYRDKNSY